MTESVKARNNDRRGARESDWLSQDGLDALSEGLMNLTDLVAVPEHLTNENRDN